MKFSADVYYLFRNEKTDDAQHFLCLFYPPIMTFQTDEEKKKLLYVCVNGIHPTFSTLFMSLI
jgi:hypothetical protein